MWSRRGYRVVWHSRLVVRSRGHHDDVWYSRPRMTGVSLVNPGSRLSDSKLTGVWVVWSGGTVGRALLMKA